MQRTENHPPRTSRWRHPALAVIAVLVATASLVSFAESYRGLYLWADRHDLHGLWAYAWPLQVDVFIAVGELALFVGLAASWPARTRMAAWAVTGLGVAVSVAGNVGHVAAGTAADRVTWAVPPLAAAGALAVGLGILKRVTADQAPAVPVPVPVAANGHKPLPTVREIRTVYQCSQVTAEKIRKAMRTRA